MFVIPSSMAASRAKRLLLPWATFGTLFVNASPAPTTTSSSSTASATGLSLSTDITKSIPICALSCFKSFIEINYNTSGCGSSPALQCLCQNTGSTGYTIGEGATQCIVAENNIGNCRNASYGSAAVDTAYGMCNDVPNAAPETHATLTATLILESGSIVVAPPTATSTTNLNSTTVATMPTPTSTLISSSSSTSASTSTSTISTATPAAATSSTASATPSSNTSSSLTRAQIVGIAGGVAAIALLTALLALFLILRRRKQRPSPAFSRMRDSSWSLSLKRNLQGSPGGSLPISQPRYQEPKVMSFTRALAKRVSTKPDRMPGPNYGLAISPGGDGRKPGTGVGLDHVVHSPVGAPPFVVRNVPRSPSPGSPVPPMSPRRALSSFKFLSQDSSAQQQQKQQQQQRQQQRPTLALAIPQRASTQGGRDSVITEFAEDGDDGPGSALIWRPPNSADPRSAAASTYYVADRWGNWVLRQNSRYLGSKSNKSTTPEAAELATPISKTKEEKAREEVDSAVPESAAVQELRHYSSPTVPEAVMLAGKRASAAPRPTIRLVTPDHGRLPINSRGASSVYSSHPSMPQYMTPGSENPMPQPMPSRLANDAVMLRGSGAKGSRRRSKSDTRRPPPERQGSRDSTTTIMSQDSAATTIEDASSPVEDMINAVLDDLVFPQPPRQSTLPPSHPPKDLSPVVESPNTGRASPVRYPQIPRAQSTNKYKALGPNKRPLPNPLLARIIAGQRLEQPLRDSPTLGLNEPVQSRQGSLNNNLHLRPAGSPSPGAMQQQQPRKPSDRALLPSQRISVYDAYNDPSSQQQRPVAYPNVSQAPTRQDRRYRPTEQTPSQRPRLAPGQPYAPPSEQRNLSPFQTFMPSPPSTSEEELSSQPQGVVVRSVDDGRRYSTHSTTAPGWKPQLTPRRQGDDLYLSVQ